METTNNFFEDKLNAFDVALINLRTGQWGTNLSPYQRIERYFHHLNKIISEIETMLSPKLLNEEKEKLGWIKEYLGKITTTNHDGVIDDEDGNFVQENITTEIDFEMGIIILNKKEELFRNVVERLSTKTRTH